MVKIAINGFGRLGRQVLKVAIKRYKEKAVADLPRVVMINDPKITKECVGYLIKNDTYYGKFPGDICGTEDALTIDGQKILISKERKIDKVKWKKFGVDYVIDTTGLHTTCATASKYISSGVKRAIVTGCANIPMFIMGVNHACFTTEMKTVSAATPSMNCLAILLKVLHENFNIKGALASAFLPLTTRDKILDDAGAVNCVASRAAIMSFSPTGSSTTRKCVDKIMPELEGKTQSTAFKIPVPCVGGVDVTAKFCKEAPVELIRCKMKTASETYLKGILGYNDEKLVSSDILGNDKSCIFDSKSAVNCSMTTAKIFAWYDSEYAFANRLFELAKYISSREDCK